MSARKHRLFASASYDREGITRALERMAARGWMLENMGTYFWTYRRCEPVRAEFACVWLSGDAGDREEYRALAEHDGWEFVCGLSGRLIFMNRRERPVPLESDPVVELAQIRRMMARENMILLITGLALVFMALTVFAVIGSPLDFLADCRALFCAAGLAAAVLFCAVQLAAWAIWLARARKWAGRGALPPAGWATALLRAGLALLAAIAALYVACTGIYGSVWMMSVQLGVLLAIVLASSAGDYVRGRASLKTRGQSEEAGDLPGFAANLGVFLLCSALIMLGAYAAVRSGLVSEGEFMGEPDPPLTMETLCGDARGYESRASWAASPLMETYSRTEFRIGAEEPAGPSWLYYSLTRTGFPSIYALCRGELLAAYPDAAASDPAPWGADEAYSVGEGRWLLFYAESTVLFEFDSAPDETQYEAVRAAFTEVD